MPDPLADPIADDIAAASVRLRSSHGHAPALDILDLVMQGRHGMALQFGGHGWPPSAFSLVLAEAFDDTMSPAQWQAQTGPQADPQLRAALLALWPLQVWSPFVGRYGLQA